MTEQLREKINCNLCGDLECDFHPIEEAAECSQHLPKADQILTLTDTYYKEKYAGYKSPEEVAFFTADVARAEGYVKDTTYGTTYQEREAMRTQNDLK